MAGSKLAVCVADIADRAIKAGAVEGTVDAGLRLVLPQGITIVVDRLHEALAAAKIPAENAAGEQYEITALELLQALLADD